jgi:hypothetical protein
MKDRSISLKRRFTAEACQAGAGNLVEFAQQLLDWLRQSSPAASPTTLATVEEEIRETWHRRHDMIQCGGF